MGDGNAGRTDRLPRGGGARTELLLARCLFQQSASMLSSSIAIASHSTLNSDARYFLLLLSRIYQQGIRIASCEKHRRQEPTQQPVRIPEFLALKVGDTAVFNRPTGAINANHVSGAIRDRHLRHPAFGAFVHIGTQRLRLTSQRSNAIHPRKVSLLLRLSRCPPTIFGLRSDAPGLAPA